MSDTQPQQPQPQAQVQQPPPQSQGLLLQGHLFLSLPLFVFALVLLVRALPWSKSVLERPPLSCDVCVTFWGSAAVGVLLTWMTSAHWSWTLLHMFSAPGVAILLLAAHKLLTRPRELPLPPIPPPAAAP